MLPKVAVTFIFPLAIICLLTGMVSAGHLQPRGTFVSPTKTAPPDLTAKPVSSNDSPTDAEPGSGWLTVKMRVTAYCPCSKCCGEYSDGQTASGHKIRPGDGFVAADCRYDFGTQMLVPGYNNSRAVKVLDRGGAIRGNRLDLFFHTHQEALNWGVQYLEVRIYENPTGS
jgi:3D (Asp-Asp-Asp) domain-containing protein